MNSQGAFVVVIFAIFLLIANLSYADNDWAEFFSNLFRFFERFIWPICVLAGIYAFGYAVVEEFEKNKKK